MVIAVSMGRGATGLFAGMESSILSAQDREEEKLCRAVKRLHTTSSNTDISTSSSEVRFADLYILYPYGQSYPLPHCLKAPLHQPSHRW